jgi:hypothetical protein
MRKVTAQVVRAFFQGKKKKVANTSTDGQAIYLHGNKIVRKTQGGGIEISTGGWNTVTTRERLNAFARVSQSNWQLYLNGFPWDGSWTKV